MTILRAVALAWADLLRPRILSLALMGLGLTLALLIALQAAIFWAIRYFVTGAISLPWIGRLDLGDTLSWGSLALLPVLGIFLMAPVAAGFAGLFTDQVADKVEEIHYPARRGRSPDFLDGVLESLAVVLAVLGVTLLSLMLAPFAGPLTPILFFGANGWLLGREFFQMAARRHMDAPAATALRKAHAGRVTLAGAMVAVALSLPLVNIAMPLLAAAAFTHLFHLISAADGPDSRYPRG
ncbi:Uncharacterized protein involved in cysteine biosynthesis [Paracoccus alcaliphilus]|uniref:Uncharacterized protein involved in cysteine biosynthesis n=1 Tax=Paracoccus alcaliphilus TaxID=34002 RepID=A0A1H8I4D3_9RHOB|nr:EI24 domain-containing protein [Paracoccus alcaliphilus]WCR19505.1 EI24 domain-containing protein [Paracoccus alcaliphilus]SEN63329.1 Uncharacterized protein involved in cysteine biosynthesis [Paracoccus alcaliphilus]